jgi:hypothetical protein
MPLNRPGRAMLAAASMLAGAIGLASGPQLAGGQAPLTAAQPSGSAAASLPIVDPTVPANRQVEPVILTGADFPGWAVPANATAKAPFTDLAGCPPGANLNNCSHNGYAKPEVDTSGAQNQVVTNGILPQRVLGYRWTGRRFVQIPFQVDKVFTRYLENDASGFAFYSGADQHTTYQFDREGFRYTKSDPKNPCLAVADSPPAKAPIPYLDTQDELAFMFSDSGGAAPKGAKLPRGIADMRQVSLSDPLNPNAATRYVYVMEAGPKGPKPAFNASNGYVRYTRDRNADFFAFSQSSYSDYGNAATGMVCDDNGKVIRDAHGNPVVGRRRPRDFATITTPRYSFRYDGRWLMTGIGISPRDNWLYGPNVVDRWKARAFQQDPSSKTPCCGFEEEDTHWGGSSTLLGERVGPVRAIRATWGADSGTNVIRMETFYRDQVRQKSWLRVHVIPPLDGIYAQWDFRAGRMTRYFNPNVPAGVPVDGKNDTVFGNLDDPCNSNYDQNNLGTGIQAPGTPLNGLDPNQTFRHTYQQATICKSPYPYHQSINLADPTFESVNASLPWNEITGPWGTIVDRYQLDRATDLTPGGAPQTLVAEPYYRDDSCFDDGTGGDPGPRVKPGSRDEPRVASDGKPRRCWTPADGIPKPGDDHFFQGDIGTHGLHLLFQLESDNARQTVPVDEIVSEQRMVMLPGQKPNVGEQYGREFEKPLLTRASSP